MKYGDIEVERDGLIALLEIQRPPNNFFDVNLINDMADALDVLDADVNMRAYVLCAQGKHFCAGANFGDPARNAARPVRFTDGVNPLYAAAVRLFSCKKPIIAAVQGAAVGGGFGLAVPIFASPVPRRASRRTSSSSAFTPASVSHIHCRRSSANRGPTCCS